MKNNKKIKRLCLLFFSVCSVFFMVSLPVGARNEGNTEVIARIEANSQTESSQPVDDNTVPTGDLTSKCVVGSFLLLITSILIIYMCNKNSGHSHK